MTGDVEHPGPLCFNCEVPFPHGSLELCCPAPFKEGAQQPGSDFLFAFAQNLRGSTRPWMLALGAGTLL